MSINLISMAIYYTNSIYYGIQSYATYHVEGFEKYIMKWIHAPVSIVECT